VAGALAGRHHSCASQTRGRRGLPPAGLRPSRGMGDVMGPRRSQSRCAWAPDPSVGPRFFAVQPGDVTSSPPRPPRTATPPPPPPPPSAPPPPAPPPPPSPPSQPPPRSAPPSPSAPPPPPRSSPAPRPPPAVLGPLMSRITFPLLSVTVSSTFAPLPTPSR